MIQEIAPKHYDNAYHPRPPREQDHMLFYDGGRILVKKEDGIRYPTFAESGAGESIYLFTIDEEGFYLGDRSLAEGLLEKGYVFENISILRRGGAKYLRFAGVTGWQLYNWYESRKFCGRCSALMVQDEKERMMRCPECGLMEFPKICPAVIIGVTDGGRILMSKYAGREYKAYALLAGFAEIGEPIEDTVRREVMEEVGLQVKNITYYKSQPWSFSDTLLLGFFCELDGEDKIRLDEQELALAEWVERKDITVEPDDLSLTNEMMLAFKNGDRV
ncbi:NAD(+) diphosphatase [Merdimonas faecis]|uniref:NAD(+) diphosphatase n=1 Tax=Merdimonas faecis TaxID=1653435 RepID=UPI0008637966|nr:NAD(+) diphosphatase [Merdimonas faecis]